MMYNGYLYHVNTLKKFSVGEKLSFGESPNYFCSRLFGYSFQNENGDDINKIVLSKPLNDLSLVEKSKLKGYVYESCAIIRELVLENYRLQNYPELPSRLKCLYTTLNLEEAEKWSAIIPRMNNKQKPLQIVKLKVNGKIFKGNGNLMRRNTFSVNDKYEMAKQYWDISNKNFDEILFEGNAEVVEVVKVFGDKTE